MMLEGKEVRKYVFGRMSRVLQMRHDGALHKARVIVEVEAFSKDHAVKRLEDRWPNIARREWDFIDEYDFDCDIGMFGEKLSLVPKIAPPRPAHSMLARVAIAKAMLSSLYGKFGKK